MKLIKHNCPVEGEMYIEKGKPCNWCPMFDKKDSGITENHGKASANPQIPNPIKLCPAEKTRNSIIVE